MQSKKLYEISICMEIIKINIFILQVSATLNSDLWLILFSYFHFVKVFDTFYNRPLHCAGDEQYRESLDCFLVLILYLRFLSKTNARLSLKFSIVFIF